MSDQIVQAPFVKYVPTTEIPFTQNPFEGNILNYNAEGDLTFTPISTFRGMIVSGVKGEATPTSSPTPWAPGAPDLFEKWDVKTAGTYTNFKDGSTPTPQSIVVTNSDLADNFVQIWVKNGVSQKALSAKPEVSGIIESWTAQTYTGLVQVAYLNKVYELPLGQTAASTDVPGTSAKWVEKVGVNIDSTFKTYIRPVFEVGGIALNTGANDNSTTLRGRTAGFVLKSNMSQIELIGDMLFQSIFYYNDAGVFVSGSRQDVNAKTFTPTFPATATKAKVTVFHTVNTQTVTQAELDALTFKFYAETPTSMKTVVDNSMAAGSLSANYEGFSVNLGEKVFKELGRLVLTNGANASSTTGIRTDFIPIFPGENTIVPALGYRTSRVLNFKDGGVPPGASTCNNTTLANEKFTIPNDGTVNQVKIVFEKLPDGTATITDAEVSAFKFQLYNPNYNKYAQLSVQANKSEPAKDVLYLKNEQVVLSGTRDIDINFDLTNRKLIISGGFVIQTNDTVVGRILLPTGTTGTDMPSSIINGVVLLNRANNSIVIQTNTAAPLLNHYVICTYYYDGNPATFAVTGLRNYSVNGVPANQKDIRQSNRFAVDNFNLPYWSAPVQTGVDPTIINSDYLYGLYTNLLTAFPTNVTKTVLGTTDGPTPYEVWRLDISFNRRTPANQRRRKPRIFICGGMHGGEKLSSYTVYLFLNYLLSTPDSDPAVSNMITMLKTMFDWTIIPIANPYAMNSGGNARHNFNGVDINRNYDYRWNEFTAGNTPGSDIYKGTAPFSEKESQFVRDTFNAIKSDTVLYVDCHNFGSSGLSDGARLVWLATTFNTVQNAVYAYCDRIDMEFKKRYSTIPKGTLIAFSDIDATSPMSQSWISNQQVFAATLETDQQDTFNTGGTNFNSNVITRSLEAYVNAFYSLGKAAVELYNSRL